MLGSFVLSIAMPTLFQELDKTKTDRWISSQSHFLNFLSVVLSLGKRNYPENMYVVVCPNKQRSFESSVCSDLVLER